MVSEIKTIKDIDNETWNKFKEFASKQDLNLGEFFKTMVNEHERNSQSFWDAILKGKKIITEAEAKELKVATQRIRKEYGFRR